MAVVGASLLYSGAGVARSGGGGAGVVGTPPWGVAEMLV